MAYLVEANSISVVYRHLWSQFVNAFRAVMSRSGIASRPPLEIANRVVVGLSDAEFIVSRFPKSFSHLVTYLTKKTP